MNVFLRITIYTLIIIKPPINFCQNFDKSNYPVQTNASSLDQNLDGLKYRSYRDTNNTSIFDANYAKVPAELLDPTFGIINYDKKDFNNSNERDSILLATLQEMRSIDLDAEKYANVFSKAFAAGYSAALVDKLTQQKTNNANVNVIANANTDTPKKVAKMINRGVPGGYCVGNACGKNRLQTEERKKYSKELEKLPFNITSDAVGYGAAYASGYALAAADKKARLSGNNQSELQPWKMNNAAAAGYAAYYAAAIAQTRAVRQPVINENMPEGSSYKKTRQGNESDPVEGDDTYVTRNNNELVHKIGLNSELIPKESMHNGVVNSDDNIATNIDQNSPIDRRLITNKLALRSADTQLADSKKKQRNVQIYEPTKDRDENIRNLYLNIDQNPLDGTGTISNTAPLSKGDNGLDTIQNDANIETNLIIQDVHDKNIIADSGNDLTLDIDPSSLDNKRCISDEANTFVNRSAHISDNHEFQKQYNQGPDDRGQVSQGTSSALVRPVDQNFVEVLVVPIKHNRKRKRSRKCSKIRRRRKKKEMLIN